ncbi:MAG: LysM peptidoglycan-binding domain-containing protein [Firmicutes bacterium]|nr:LysM peptidoglycan-binding domain-containing protein [Bacillota bacterium]
MHRRPHVNHVNIVVRPSDTLFFLAGIFGVSVEEILAANPGIKDPNTIFPGQIISIPADAPVPPDPGFSRAQYLVRAGDTLFFIARQFGISLDALIAANPQITNPNLIFVNQVINLPVTPPLPAPPTSKTIQIYVSGGETLFSISRRTGVSVDAIIAANPQIRDPNIIFAGQIINVPVGRKENDRLLNIVAIEGDTLFELAEIFGVTVSEILAVNPGIVNPNIIFPGQIIAIPADPPRPPDPGSARAQYLVRPGDTLFSIARRFGLTVPLLLAQNPQIDDPDQIFVNQVINLVVTPPLPPDPPPDTIQIYVSAGETLSSIARRTGVSVQAILNANPQIEDPDIIFVGQIINVPLNCF